MLFNLTRDELRKVIMFIELHGPANTYDHFFPFYTRVNEVCDTSNFLRNLNFGDDEINFDDHYSEFEDALQKFLSITENMEKSAKKKKKL